MVGKAPLTQIEILQKRHLLSQLFSPTAPIEEEELFAGRSAQTERLFDSVLQRGQHVVVYGDRGVGKTSFVNTFASKIFHASVSNTHFYFGKCFKNDDFSDIWEHVFEDAKYPKSDEFISDDIDSSFSSKTVLKICKKLESAEVPVLVFDEFDRIESEDVKLALAETIKLLSDESARTTVIVVGIGRTIDELLTEHKSVARAARQIEMPRMSAKEVRELITLRLQKVGMSISVKAVNRIITLARGMPGYAHLIGLYSAIEAVKSGDTQVGVAEVNGCLEKCIEEAGESVRQAYSKATGSSKPNAQFKEALLACALAVQDDLGAFKAASVREPLSTILGVSREIPSFARHLKGFCSEERGEVLVQTGTPKNYKYHFNDPMMQSFIIIRGLSDGTLTDEVADTLTNVRIARDGE